MGRGICPIADFAVFNISLLITYAQVFLARVVKNGSRQIQRGCAQNQQSQHNPNLVGLIGFPRTTPACVETQNAEIVFSLHFLSVFNARFMKHGMVLMKYCSSFAT